MKAYCLAICVLGHLGTCAHVYVHIRVILTIYLDRQVLQAPYLADWVFLLTPEVPST